MFYFFEIIHRSPHTHQPNPLHPEKCKTSESDVGKRKEKDELRDALGRLAAEAGLVFGDITRGTES